MICVVATKEPLIIPDSLLENQIKVVRPASTLSDDQVDLMFEYVMNYKKFRILTFVDVKK